MAQAIALAVAACCVAGLAAAAVAAAAFSIVADSQSNHLEPVQPLQPPLQTPAKRPAAPTAMGAPLKKVKQTTLFASDLASTCTLAIPHTPPDLIVSVQSGTVCASLICGNLLGIQFFFPVCIQKRLRQEED